MLRLVYSLLLAATLAPGVWSRRLAQLESWLVLDSGPHFTDIGIDDALAPAVGDFLRAYQEHGGDMPDPLADVYVVHLVAMGDPLFQGDPTNLGVCITYPLPGFSQAHVWHEIYLSQALQESPLRLRWALYHELGHCVFGLGHERGDGIMSPAVPREHARLVSHWDQSVQSFFRQAAMRSPRPDFR